MLQTRAGLGLNIFRHWETWAGWLVFGLCIVFFDEFGARFGHSLVGAMIGAWVGIFVVHKTSGHVARRYYQAVLFKSEQ